MTKPQVNVALSQDDRDVLDAVAFVEEASATEVLRPVIAAFLNKQRNDADVKAALAALEGRRRRRARNVGNVSSTKQPRRTRSASSD